MNKNLLIVLFGLPGCGKSTVIQAFARLHPEFKTIDIFDYIKQYLDEHGESEIFDYARRAHRQLFTELQGYGGQIVLELGTNYPRWVVKSLKRLSQKRQLLIFICQLSRDECVNRLVQRQRGIPMSKEASAIRLKRNFPQSHTVRLERRKLPYYQLDMTKKPLANAREIEAIIANKCLPARAGGPETSKY